MRYIISLIGLITCLNGCSQSLPQNDSAYVNWVKNERLKLRNAAFCECLYSSYPDKSTFKNEGSGSGYLQLGAHGIDTYIKVFEYAQEAAKKPYPSKENKDMVIMKCLDFYNSKELNDLILSLDAELDSTKFIK